MPSAKRTHRTDSNLTEEDIARITDAMLQCVRTMSGTREIEHADDAVLESGESDIPEAEDGLPPPFTAPLS